MFLLGCEISHSASPAHWKKTFSEKNLNWTYELADIADENEAKKFILKKGFVAINITTPWKNLAFSLASKADGASNFARGCNFLVNEEGRLSGYNVDGAGCVGYLESTGFKFDSANIFVCGFGPTAKSVAYACKSAGAKVSVMTRTVTGERQAQCNNFGIELKTYDCNLSRADLVINATTLGMNAGDGSVIDLEKMNDHCVYFDCIYGHGETQFIKNAKLCGAVCYDGSGMLEAQAYECEKILFENMS